MKLNPSTFSAGEKSVERSPFDHQNGCAGNHRTGVDKNHTGWGPWYRSEKVGGMQPLGWFRGKRVKFKTETLAGIVY